MSRSIYAAFALLCLPALGGPLGAPTPAAAQSDCTQWSVADGWYAVQGSYRVRFVLQQSGAGLQGEGEVEGGPTNDGIFAPFGTPTKGAVNGTVKGNNVELNTGWGGVYLGTIDATGRIDGTTYDKRNSTSSASWYSDRRMNCLARASDPPAPAPKKVVGLGKRQPGAVAAIPPAATLDAAVLAPPGTCLTGYVWRVARPDDLVCVTPDSRARVAQENATAGDRVEPGGGPYGPATCRSGYVWREAFSGDLVCVTPDIRAFVLEENRLGPSRRVQ